jgi:protein-S-isoprenylcysteine O-methyltransferase Ste14
MNNLWIYAFHSLFWLAFIARRLGAFGTPGSTGPAAAETKTAPFSRALVLFHVFGFFVLYVSIRLSLFAGVATDLGRAIGAALITSGAALAIWALLVFRSWRLRAEIGEGHELVTKGPYARIRHPIYTANNLLGLGTLAWFPTWPIAGAVVLIALGGELRARAEEKILIASFGDAYRSYMARTKRFVPFVY